jgi:hypothetical protein
MMQNPPYGRIVFGAAALLAGVVALLWPDSDMRQHLRPLGTSLGTIVAWCFAIAGGIGGIGMLHPRTARPASIVIGVIYGLFALACIPGIILGPKAYVHYGALFEQLAVACGALAAFAAGEPDGARSTALSRLARLALGLCATSFALAQLVYLRFTASLVPAWVPPNPLFWAITTTLAFALAAAAMLANVRAGLAIRLMSLMLALFGVLVWIPHLIVAPAALADWSEFAETFLIAGAAWMVAEVTA